MTYTRMLDAKVTIIVDWLKLQNLAYWAEREGNPVEVPRRERLGIELGRNVCLNVVGWSPEFEQWLKTNGIRYSVSTLGRAVLGR